MDQIILKVQEITNEIKRIDKRVNVINKDIFSSLSNDEEISKELVDEIVENNNKRNKCMNEINNLYYTIITKHLK